MRIIKTKYRTGADFLAAYQTNSLFGGVFFPTREVMAAGEPVIVEIRFPGLIDRVMVRSTVAWRRAGRLKDGTRAGLGIDFLPVERPKRDFLLAVARGESAARPVVPRNHRRLPTSFEVRWHVKSERDRFPALLDDIGPGGAFLRTDGKAIDVGTPLVIELVPPGAAAAFSIEGRVAWARDAANGAEGVGVEFRCRDTGGLRRLKELVRRLEQLEPTKAA